MSVLLDFGPQFPYLAAAYGFVALALGGYLLSLMLKERDLERLRARRRDDG